MKTANDTDACFFVKTAFVVAALVARQCAVLREGHDVLVHVHLPQPPNVVAVDAALVRVRAVAALGFEEFYLFGLFLRFFRF